MARRLTIRPTESDEQQAVIAWADLAMRHWPELALLHAVPNGSFRGKDPRAAAIHANRLTREGMRKGWPDLSLPTAHGPFIGLAIELKRPGEPPSSVSKEQRQYLDLLAAHGHKTAVCFGSDQAINTIREYLALPAGNYSRPTTIPAAVNPSLPNNHDAPQCARAPFNDSAPASTP